MVVDYVVYAQKLKLGAKNSKTEFIKKDQDVLLLNMKVNLSHVELTLCSGILFQKFRHHSSKNTSFRRNIWKAFWQSPGWPFVSIS
jgi:hypothetical protein